MAGSTLVKDGLRRGGGLVRKGVVREGVLEGEMVLGWDAPDGEGGDGLYRRNRHHLAFSCCDVEVKCWTGRVTCWAS